MNIRKFHPQLSKNWPMEQKTKNKSSDCRCGNCNKIDRRHYEKCEEIKRRSIVYHSVATQYMTMIFLAIRMKFGGEGEIRTPETFSRLLAFQASALGHYATSPRTVMARSEGQLTMNPREPQDLERKRHREAMGLMGPIAGAIPHREKRAPKRKTVGLPLRHCKFHTVPCRQPCASYRPQRPGRMQ